MDDEIIEQVLEFNIKVMTNKGVEKEICYSDIKQHISSSISQFKDSSDGIIELEFKLKCLGYSISILDTETTDRNVKIDHNYYVLKIQYNDETLYLTEEYKFDPDIHEALKAKNLMTARYIQINLLQKYKIELEIVPLKITSEWE